MGVVKKSKENIENVINTCQDWMTERPRTTGIFTGINSSILGRLLIDIAEKYNVTHISENWELFPISWSILAGFTMGMVSYYKRKSLGGLKKLGLSLKSLEEGINKEVIVKKEGRNLKEKILDYLIEKPILGSLVGGTSLIIPGITTNILIKDKGIPEDFFQKLIMRPFEDKNYILTALTYSFVYVCLKKGIKRNSSVTKARRQLYQKMFYTNKPFSLKKRLERIRKISKKGRVPEIMYEHANLAANAGHYKESFRVILDIYEKREHELAEFHPYMKIRHALFNIQKYFSKMEENPKNPAPYFLIYSHLDLLGEKEKKFNVMNKFIEINDRIPKRKKDANLSYSILLRKSGEEEAFIKQMSKTFGLVEENLSQIGNHEVFEITGDVFSNQTVISRKSHNIKSLVDEINYNKQIRTNFNKQNNDDMFKIIDDPTIVPFKDFFFGVTDYEDGQILYDYLNETKDISSLKKVAKFLGRIHGTNKLYRKISKKEHIKRIKDSAAGMDDLRVRKAANKIFENLDFLVKEFAGMTTVVDVDAHAFNWSKGDFRYTKIDNDFRKPTLPVYEISKLMEQGEFFEKTLIGDVDRYEVMKEYYNEVSKYHDIGSFRKFMRNKLKADAIKFTTLVFYRIKKDDVDLKLIKETYNNAIHSLDSLTHFYSNSKESLKKINDIKIGVLGLMNAVNPSSQLTPSRSNMQESMAEYIDLEKILVQP